jgi:hypothetical protein
MTRTMIAIGIILAAGLAPGLASAYGHANRFGGSSVRGFGGAEHTNAFGGSTEHAWGGGTEHTNAYGGHTEGEAGYGAEHTNVYGGTTAGRVGEGAYHTTPYGATAYAAPVAAYPYHPPTTVNYYAPGCYNCGGWNTAGAVAAGVVVGAAVATAAESSKKPAAPTYVVGNIYPALPTGCVKPTVSGKTYYLCSNTWFQPQFGANGVYYKVVPAP